MSKTLNDTQRKLVEDNHNLIYSYLHSHNLSLDAIEDWYGTAAIGLCKAALVYDENRGAKFSTLAYICMDREVKLIMRKSKRSVRATMSLDAELTSGDGGCYLTDLVADPYDFTSTIFINDAIRIATEGLSSRDKTIIHMIVDLGMSQKKISDQFGISQAMVSRIYKKYMGKIRDYFND